MRRVDDPSPASHGPGTRERSGSGTVVDWANLSHALLPAAVRRRAVSVSVETDRRTYAPADPVRIRVRFRNRLPVPVSIPVVEAVPWSWSVAGVERASHVESDAVPRSRGRFDFGRGETKTFERVWRQRVRESTTEWSAAARGECPIRVWIATGEGPAGRLAAGTTVRLTSK